MPVAPLLPHIAFVFGPVEATALLHYHGSEGARRQLGRIIDELMRSITPGSPPSYFLAYDYAQGTQEVDPHLLKYVSDRFAYCPARPFRESLFGAVKQRGQLWMLTPETSGAPQPASCRIALVIGEQERWLFTQTTLGTQTGLASKMAAAVRNAAQGLHEVGLVVFYGRTDPTALATGGAMETVTALLKPDGFTPLEATAVVRTPYVRQNIRHIVLRGFFRASAASIAGLFLFFCMKDLVSLHTSST